MNPEQRSIRRLLRDWKAFTESQQFPTMALKPNDDNINEWHGNFRPDSGPYQGIIFHVILKFNTEYFDNFGEYSNQISFLSYDVVGLIYYLILKNDHEINNNLFIEEIISFFSIVPFKIN